MDHTRSFDGIRWNEFLAHRPLDSRAVAVPAIPAFSLLEILLRGNHGIADEFLGAVLLKRAILASLVLVLNEMVLVLDAVSSNTSTSTANAEYEYEKDKENMIAASMDSEIATSKGIRRHPSGYTEIF